MNGERVIEALLSALAALGLVLSIVGAWLAMRATPILGADENGSGTLVGGGPIEQLVAKQRRSWALLVAGFGLQFAAATLSTVLPFVREPDNGAARVLAAEESCLAAAVLHQARAESLDTFGLGQDPTRVVELIRADAVAEYAQDRLVAYAAVDSALNHSAASTDSIRFMRVAEMSLSNATVRKDAWETMLGATLASDSIEFIYRERFLKAISEASDCRNR